MSLALGIERGRVASARVSFIHVEIGTLDMQRSLRRCALKKKKKKKHTTHCFFWQTIEPKKPKFGERGKSLGAVEVG